jgi:hypothetical protein
MLVPFVVVTADARRGPYENDRTDFYLVDGFQQLYGDEVVTLPSWPAWVAVVRGLAPHARAAFAGEENLHAFTSDIGALKAVYDSLVEEAAERGLAWR